MENLVLKINQKEIKVKENQTTLKGVRLVVSYTIEKLGINKKECMLTLPNGSVIEYKKLNNVKAFECLLLPSIKLLDDKTEIGAKYTEMLAIVRKRILNLPLKWENVGNTNLNYGYDLYSNTILNLIEENVLDKVSVYVTTYKKYDEKNLSGEWLTLGNYKNYEDFIQACKDLHKDEENPKLMFFNWKGAKVFKLFIQEIGIDKNIFLLNDLGEIEDYVIAYIAYVGEVSQEIVEEAQEKYVGEFENYEELGQYFVEEIDAMEIPKGLEYYIDYEKYGRDISYDLIEVGDYYFWN